MPPFLYLVYTLRSFLGLPDEVPPHDIAEYKSQANQTPQVMVQSPVGTGPERGGNHDPAFMGDQDFLPQPPVDLELGGNHDPAFMEDQDFFPQPPVDLELGLGGNHAPAFMEEPVDRGRELGGNQDQEFMAVMALFPL